MQMNSSILKNIGHRGDFAARAYEACGKQSPAAKCNEHREQYLSANQWISRLNEATKPLAERLAGLFMRMDDDALTLSPLEEYHAVLFCETNAIDGYYSGILDGMEPETAMAPVLQNAARFIHQHQPEFNDEALALATTLSGLRSLKGRNTGMTSEDQHAERSKVLSIFQNAGQMFSLSLFHLFKACEADPAIAPDACSPNMTAVDGSLGYEDADGTFIECPPMCPAE